MTQTPLEYVNERRRELASYIATLEEVAQFRLRVVIAQGEDVTTDVLLNALMAAVALLKLEMSKGDALARELESVEP